MAEPKQDVYIIGREYTLCSDYELGFSRTGYSFAGWTDASGNVSAAGARVVFDRSDVDVSAKWDPVRYSVAYLLDGGVNGDNPTSYTIESETSVLNPASKFQHGFVKWTENGTQVTAIQKGSYGDRVLSANYVRTKVTAKYDCNWAGPLYFEAQGEGAMIAFEKVGSPWEANFLSSADGKAWNEYAVGTTYSFPSIGSRFYLKRADGVNTGLLSKSMSNYYNFVMYKRIAAYGNIQWLLDSTGQSLSCSSYCYCRMFYGCTSLTQAPELPATALANYCYWAMFYYCSSLVQAPALPALALANYCYEGMFQNCASLTQAPALPATALANSCYESMFYGCTSLTQAPELPATALANYCYVQMFYGCTSLTHAPELSAMELAGNCYCGMFQNCTSLNQAPALPATELDNQCYAQMFQNCTSLSVNENVEEGSLVLSVASGTEEPIGWSGDMFSHTAGRFKGTPTVGNVYRCYGQTQFDSKLNA